MSSDGEVQDGSPVGDSPQLSVGERARPRRARVLMLLAVLVAGYLGLDLIARVDWSAVGHALRLLEWWQAPILLVVLLARQTLNALPLALFVRGLGVRRALVNDLSAHLLAVAVPPPGDIVMRIAMFRHWGFTTTRALAGVTMNTVAFYVNRFASPVVGLLLFALFQGTIGHLWGALLSGLVSLILALGSFLVVRQERHARWLGLSAGRLVRRVRPSVDPDAWAASVVLFRQEASGSYRRGFPQSLAGLCLMVLADATILLLALRFVGVTGQELPGLEVIALFYVAYPLTLFPLMGLGVLDAVLLGSFVEIGGAAVEAEVVAALAIWRSTTLITPVLLGAVTLASWKRVAAQ